MNKKQKEKIIWSLRIFQWFTLLLLLIFGLKAIALFFKKGLLDVFEVFVLMLLLSFLVLWRIDKS